MNKQHYKIRPFVFTILSVLLIVFIFSNSLKNGEESNAQSAPIVEVVEEILDPEDKVPTKTFNFLVRKAAHLTEFAVLGLVLGGQIWCINGIRHGNGYHVWLIVQGLMVGFVIAVADEYIQSFTDRTSSITDVLIDMIGVVIGMCLAKLVSCLWRKYGTCKCRGD